MTLHDLLVAGVSIAIGLGVALAFYAPLRRRRAVLAQDLRLEHATLNRFEAASDVFEHAVILIDSGTPSLVAGEHWLRACAVALGADAELPDILEAISRLDPAHGESLDALAQRGEPCGFIAHGPAGTVRVDGRSGGAWAWLRLGIARDPPAITSGNVQLSALIDSQPDPAWIAGSNGEPTWVNRGWLEAVGVASLEEARARGGNLDSSVNALARSAALGGTVRHSLRWVAWEGGRRALSITASPIERGEVAIWARDVTALEMARETSRQAAEASALLLNHIGDAVAIFDADRVLVHHNPAFATLWDLEPAWLADRPSHGELLDRLRQRRQLPETVDYARFKADELACHQQVEAASEDIWRLPTERTLRIVRLSQPGGGLTLIYSDITPELRLKSQFNHLIQVQRATLDKLSDAVAVFGADGRLRLHNEAFETFWGIPAGQLQRTPDFEGVAELCIPRLHDRQFWRDLKARITDLDPLARAPAQLEMTTAERRVVAFQSRPLPDGATLIGFSDITDTRRLEEALGDREAALAEAERLKRAFVGSVSYELRTPLTTIIGYSELLESGVSGLGEHERGYVSAVRAAAVHLARSINDVLETAEIDAGETVLEIGDVDVADLLRGAAERSGAEARSARVEVSVTEYDDLGLISADGARLAQVLDHLIDNALRHTPAGGRVLLSAVRTPGEICLSVADNGRGYPFDVQAHIFDRFSSHNRGGPGLGLALVRSLVELHGGWVALESEPGAGAACTCHLPDTAQAPEARPRLF